MCPHTYTVYILFILMFGLPSVLCLVIPQDPGCQNALGIESRKITDDKLTSPESGHFKGKEAYKARLNGKSAYCTPSFRVVDEGFYEEVYMEVNLVDQYKITAFALQGYVGYSYGKVMQLWTSLNGHYKRYTSNGTSVISLEGYKGDQIEFLPIKPTFASKLKIQLAYSSNSHCLRMEIYGCDADSFSEYEECKSSHQTLLQDNHSQMKFSETDAMQIGTKFTASYLVFSKLYAWCLMVGSKSDPPYNDWATIDMKDNYLIYGIQVKGYFRRHDDKDKDKREYIAKMFKFKYSLEDKIKTDLEGRKELSTLYYGTTRSFRTPLIAKYIYISMKVDATGNLTCIKLELYGCNAKLHDGTITTSPSVNPTNTTNPSTARINRYHIYQGNEYAAGIKWTDSLYNGKEVSKNELNDGTGCLTDGKSSQNDNPFSSPACWLGWKKNITKKPFIYIVLTRPTKVAGIRLRTYVNNSMKALPIRRIRLLASTRTPALSIGFVCSPDSFYNQEPKVTDYYIALGDKNLQYLQLIFEYSGLWILVRQIEFIKPGETMHNPLELSKTIIECAIPKAITGNEASAWQVTVIVIIVLVMLLLILVAFIIHHYRTNLHKVWKSRSRNSILVHVQDQQSANTDRFITSDPQRIKKPYTKVQYNKQYNKIHDDTEDIYAAVDANNSFDSGVLSDQQATYADCEDFRQKTYSPSSSHNNTPNGTMLYSVPDVKQYAVPDTKQYAIPDTKQYAEPDTLKRESVIYQGSIIYATTYENPYKATVASSFYAEPSKLPRKSQVKIFPRTQLVFKEKIGVGQFGEVHIAEANGLDEIYGTVGHFNSWGLPDTAMVAVKLLKSVDSQVEKEFMKEVEVMSRLKDENVVRLLGVCHEPPKLMVVEYMENGDLNQFLRDKKPDFRNCRTSQIGPNVLILDQLLHMAQQISAGMKYLHSVGFIHRDLATRNCLVGPAYQVKIADFGMSRYVYTKQYYRVEGKAVLPIRWMAPECLYYGKFTAETDVWSFGVTLWEIFSFAREPPYTDMNDPQVIEVACDLLQNPTRQFPYLSEPESCPVDIYELMKKCWTTHPKSRPDFTCLHRELTDKCGTSEVNI